MKESELSYYSTIPSVVIKDRFITANAKLLYALIGSLSKSKGFCYASNSYLSNLLGISESGISRVVSKLCEADYISVEYDRKNKEITQRRIYLNLKTLQEKIDKDRGGDSNQGGIDSGSRGVLTQAQRDINTLDNNKDNDALSRFSEFWSLYDKKKEVKKCKAKWKRLTKKQKDKIFEVLPNYIKQTPDKQFRKNPLTWLNGECWDDEDIQPKQQAKGAEGMTLTDWEAKAFKVGIGRYEGKHVETVEQYIERVKGKLNG